VKYLCDANMSPRVALALTEAGHDTTHVMDHGLLTASDPDIFEWAVANDHVVVTADSDFAALLALRRSTSPSVILLRDLGQRSPDDHAQILIENLPAVTDAVADGAIVSLSPTGIRIRALPIR
jgi:predicted nuclease of predicted toxin-antitoxin system